MAKLVIACLSQKGGVGKSTLARLIATSYAQHGQRVTIFDFNPNQLTSFNWSERRYIAQILPLVLSEHGSTPKTARRHLGCDVAVMDGRPDSAAITMTMARESDLIVVPTSLSIDDLEPQCAFANELIEAGILKQRIIVVINRTSDNKLMIADAFAYIKQRGLRVAENTLPYRDSFMRCHTAGYSVAEVREAVIGNMRGLTEIANALAIEIAQAAMELQNGKEPVQRRGSAS